MIVKGTASITTNTKVVTIVTLESGSTLVGVVLQGHELQWVGENAHYHVETDPTSNTTLTLLETYGGATKTAFSFQIMTGYHGHNLIRVEPEMLNAFYSLQRNFERISDLFTPLENLTGDVTSVGNVTTLTNAPVIAKVLTGYTSGAGTISATDSILSAIQKLNGNNATNANLTGPITSIGNATAIASQTGTGTTFVVNTSPTIITPTIASIIGNKLYPASDSTTAIQVLKAGGTTAIVTVDTTNSYMGIGTTPLASLHIANDGSEQIRINAIAHPTLYYSIGRNIADGLLDFQGQQAAFNGYNFKHYDGTSSVYIRDNQVGIRTTPSDLLHIGTTGNNFFRITGTSRSYKMGLANGNDFSVVDASGGQIFQVMMAGASQITTQFETHIWTNKTDAGAGEYMRIASGGLVGINAASPAVSGTGKLHIGADTFRLDTNRTPATSGATGNLGDICSDADYLYRASATNTWKRIAWTSF